MSTWVASYMSRFHSNCPCDFKPNYVKIAFMNEITANDVQCSLWKLKIRAEHVVLDITGFMSQ